MDQTLRSFSGATVRRVVDRSFGTVPEHAHDWPILSIFVMGSYENRTAVDRRHIAGPSAILYRAGAAHQNRIGGSGFEQIEIEFDPAWLGTALPRQPVTRFARAAAAAAAPGLVQACLRGSERDAGAAIGAFIAAAREPAARPAPPWVERVDALLRHDPSLRIRDIARQVGLHPAWLGAAYRQTTGETVAAAAARLRVERAARRLRETDEAPALIAVGAGFCDQSHMIRTFRRVIGRSPSAVRHDRSFMRSAGRPAYDP